jgi:chromosome segregation ATPase
MSASGMRRTGFPFQSSVEGVNTMLRKILIAGAVLLVAVIGFRALRHCHLGSYVFSQWDQICQEARNQIPTDVELNRLQYEISQMDQDIKSKARPLAELSFEIKQLKQDVGETVQDLERGKKVLQTMTAELDKGAPDGHFVINNREFDETQLKQRIGDTFNTCKLLETKLSNQKQTLNLKQSQYNAIQEQANKLATQRRQFQLQLENLRAEQEKLKIEQINSRPTEDNSRVNTIKKGIQELQKRIATQRKENDLLKQHPFADLEENNAPAAPDVNLQDVRTYLNGNANQNRTQKVTQNN